MTSPHADAGADPEPRDALDDLAPAFEGMSAEIGPIAYAASRLGEATLDEAVDRIEAAVAAGITLIDTADAWGFDPTDEDVAHGGGFGASEQRLGEVLAEVPELRDQIVLATKGGRFPPLPFDTSADHLRQACDASLYRLGVDVIDLYQVHQPDFLAHPAEVAEALTDLREAGKVREIGVCNHSASQVQTLQSFLDFPLVSVQVAFNAVRTGPLHDGTLDQAMEFGLTPLATSPLMGGALFGDDGGKRSQAVAEIFHRIAGEQGVPLAAVALSWLMHHPAGVIPVIATTRIPRIRACAQAVEVGLSRQQWYEVLAASQGRAVT